MSSDGRGIVREVRVAVFAVISRHIRRRDSLLFSLSLVLLLLRAALLLILMRVVFGWNICCEGIKRLCFSFFLLGLIFAIFSPFFGNRPPKNFLRLLLQNFYERKHFPHLHSTTHRSILRCYWVDERETRGLWRAHEGKVKRGFVCPPLRVRKRERETVLPHTTSR